MKKIIFGISILAAILVIVTACGGSEQTEPSETSQTSPASTATPLPASETEPPPPATPPPISTTDNWGALGDVNCDGLVDSIDLDLISAAIGTDNRDDDWNAELDLDRNRKIDVADLAIAGRGYGSEHSFHQARRIASGDETVSRLDACIDAQDQVHVVWSDSNYRDVYYTRLDRYGNTLIDDVLIDSGPSTGVSFVAIGCDDAGNAHIVWDGISDVCQARFDQWGYPVLEKSLVDDRWSGTGKEAAVDLDSEGNAHIFYRMGNTRIIYAVLTEEGEKPISVEDPLLYDSQVSRYRQLAIDDADNAHLVWSEEDGEDRLYYAKIGADASVSLAPMVIGYTHWDGHINDSHQPSLALDSEGNALVLWNRSDPAELFLDKIAPDGTVLLDDYPIFPQYRTSYYQDLAIDQSDQLHLWAPTGWGGGLYRNAYGIFDESLQPVEPMHWAMYGWRSYDPQLLVDSQGDAHVFYKLSGLTAEDPPCSSSGLCYQSTAFDPVAYDRTRPDLGVDVAHLDWSPILARWGETLTIEATIFNTGWTDSPATTTGFEIALEDAALASPLSADVTIPSLAPGETQTVQIELELPMTPPEGYEAVEYVNLKLEVDPGNVIAETAEANNAISVPMMIEPLPTSAGLFMIVRDITSTVSGGSETPLEIGSAHLNGSGIDRTIDVSGYITILADDLPIASEPTTYSVTWQAEGYRTPTPFEVTIGRNADDPYVIDYEPGNTVQLETDTWGSLGGTIISNEGGPITGATVRIKGHGLSINTITDAEGQFSAVNEPRLGQMIPGEYDIFLSAPDYARISGSASIVSLGRPPGIAPWSPLPKPTCAEWCTTSMAAR